MDRIQELLSRLADLADADVAELEGLILSEFDAAEAEEPSSETVERMVSLADALDEVRGEVRRRNELSQALTEKAAAAAQRVRGNANETSVKDEEEQVAEDARAVADDAEGVAEEAEAIVAEEDTEEEDEDKMPVAFAAESEELSAETPAETELSAEESTPAEEPEAPAEELSTEETDTEAPAAEVEADAETELSTETEITTDTEETTQLSADAPAVEETPQEDAVTASSNDGSGVVVTPPASAAPVLSADAARALNVTITAGADIPGYGTGSALGTMEDVSDAFAKRLHTLRNVQGGDGVQHTIATLSYEYPEDRVLGGDDPANITKVNKVISPQALTAAAGICAPLETIYDVSICGDDDRPIRDALARFNADRGGIKIFGSPSLGNNCVGVWDPKNATTKTCCDADCPTPQEIGLEAIYACMKFSNYTNRFFPEVVKANTDLALINHARAAELNLLFKIAAASTKVDNSPVAATAFKAGLNVGVARQVIAALHNAAAYLRRKHRLSANSPLRAIFPSWVKDAMVADLALQAPGDGLESLSISESRLNGLLRDAGINVTWSLETVNQAGTGNISAPTGTNGFDAEVSFALYPEGTFLFLDGGTLDLGVQRDSTMLTANEYATFVETFEGVAFTGCESLWVTIPVCVSGAAAALVDTTC